MRIVVTGAAGLIGSAVCEHLRKCGDEVIPTDRHRPHGAPPEWNTRDLISDPLDDLLQGANAVVHLAAVPSPGGTPDDVLFINNVTATFRVLDGAARNQVPRAVIASSVSIYGLVWATRELIPTSLPFCEDDDLHIEDAYALSKLADENTARMISQRSGLSVIALRLPNVSSHDDIRVRSQAVRDDIRYAHRELWAYLEIGEAGKAVRAAIAAPATGFTAINIATPQALGNIDIRAAVAEVYPSVDNSTVSSTCGYDTRRATELLSYQPTPIL